MSGMDLDELTLLIATTGLVCMLAAAAGAIGKSLEHINRAHGEWAVIATFFIFGAGLIAIGYLMQVLWGDPL